MNYLPIIEILEDLKLDYTINRMKQKNNNGITTLSKDIMITVVISDEELLEITVTDDYWRYPELTSYFLNSLHTNGSFTYRQGTPFIRDVVSILESSPGVSKGDTFIPKSSPGVSKGDTFISKSYMEYPRA